MSAMLDTLKVIFEMVGAVTTVGVLLLCALMFIYLRGEDDEKDNSKEV